MPVRRKPLRNELRVIGGVWRGRRLRFPDLPQLRPTPDRVRETLFNWLQPDISGSRCLDLYAGSGALGLEALSRGAREVWHVEQHPKACAALAAHHQTLGVAARAQLFCQDVLAFLATLPATPFDLVFLDPPFASALAAPSCALLQQRGWLAPHGKIYLETARAAPVDVPESWDLLKTQTAGEVCGRLFQVSHTAE